MEDFSQIQIVSLQFSLIFNSTIKFAESLAAPVSPCPVFPLASVMT